MQASIIRRYHSRIDRRYRIRSTAPFTYPNFRQLEFRLLPFHICATVIILKVKHHFPTKYRDDGRPEAQNHRPIEILQVPTSRRKLPIQRPISITRVRTEPNRDSARKRKKKKKKKIKRKIQPESITPVICNAGVKGHGQRLEVSRKVERRKVRGLVTNRRRRRRPDVLLFSICPAQTMSRDLIIIGASPNIVTDRPPRFAPPSLSSNIMRSA